MSQKGSNPPPKGIRPPPERDNSICSSTWCEVDEIIKVIESHGLGWSLDHTTRLIEARIWDWPNVVGRYRPTNVEPLAHMLQTAMREVPKYYWEKKV